MLVRQLLAVLGSIFVYCVLSLKSSVYLYKTLHNIINDTFVYVVQAKGKVLPVLIRVHNSSGLGMTLLIDFGLILNTFKTLSGLVHQVCKKHIGLGLV